MSKVSTKKQVLMREVSLTRSEHSMSIHDEKCVPFSYDEHPNSGSEDEVKGEELSGEPILIHSDDVKSTKCCALRTKRF